METNDSGRVDPPAVKEVKDDLDKYQSLAAVANLPGGKLLIDGLKTDIANDVEAIISLFSGEEIAIRCAIAKLKADLALYRVLIRAEENVRLAKDELSKLLEDEK
jgi:hypothetical protein